MLFALTRQNVVECLGVQNRERTVLPAEDPAGREACEQSGRRGSHCYNARQREQRNSTTHPGAMM